MSKTEHRTFRTTLTIADVRSVLRQALDGSSIEQLSTGPLDGELPPIAVVATRAGGALFNKSPYGPALACVQISVEDEREYRRVDLVLMGTTFAEGFASGLAANRSSRNAMEGWRKTNALRNQNPDIKCSRRMADAVERGLRNVDSGLRTL